METKKQQIITCINENKGTLTWGNRQGPSLELYVRLIHFRQGKNIQTLLNNEDFIFQLYNLLSAWDMNTRGARMRGFEEFKNSMVNCIEEFEEIEKLSKEEYLNMVSLKTTLRAIHDRLEIMASRAKVVAFSKILHFLFHDLFMPMDRGTFVFFYGNQGVSFNKYWTILTIVYQLKEEHPHWHAYVNTTSFNTSVLKLIDNAIHTLQ